MKTVCVIQARMGSTRLPGKMLELLAGEPLLFHIIERAKALRCADEIVLATTTSESDQKLVTLAKKLGVKAVRGSEEDVLSRFFLALEGKDAKFVVRVCGDAPLFDPEFLDNAVEQLARQDGDVIKWSDGLQRSTAYQGADVISYRALDWTKRVCGEDPLAIEHVTAYALAHVDRLRTAALPPPPDLLVGRFHLSIDTREDLESIREVYDRIYVPGEVVSLRRAVELIRSEGLGQGRLLESS